MVNNRYKNKYVGEYGVKGAMQEGALLKGNLTESFRVLEVSQCPFVYLVKIN